jgi:hypothetical protein
MNIVQIGSNRGYDDLTDYIRNNSEKIEFLLLVEPLEKFNESLNECYNFVNNKIIENLVVVDLYEDDFLTFYLDENMDTSQAQASILKNHVIKHFPNGNIVEKKIKCMQINNLFDKYQLKNIDYLFIDAEGVDDKLIRSIDFNKFNIHKIYYESTHIEIDKLNNRKCPLIHKLLQKHFRMHF